MANLVGDVNHCSVVEYGECVDIEKLVIVTGWIVVLRSITIRLFLQIRRSYAPLSDSLRGAGGVVSAHQPIGLYSRETTADQSPSENNGKHPRVTSRLRSSGGLPGKIKFFLFLIFR